MLPASAPTVEGALLGSGGRGDGGGDKGKGSKAPTCASASVFPARPEYGEAEGLLVRVLQAMTTSDIMVEVNLLDGHLDANNPTGPPITDHSTVRRVMEGVGGVLLVHSPRAQPYNGCAAVAAAAKSLHYQTKSDPTANPEPTPPQPFVSAFDLANVAALQAYEKNVQLRVGDSVQVWSLRGGCRIASRHTGVCGCVTFVDSVKGTVTFEPFRPVETPTITLPADSLAPLKSQSDLIEQFRSARATEEALAFFSRNSLIGEGHFVVTHDQFMVILLKAPPKVPPPPPPSAFPGWPPEALPSGPLLDASPSPGGLRDDLPSDDPTRRLTLNQANIQCPRSWSGGVPLADELKMQSPAKSAMCPAGR